MARLPRLRDDAFGGRLLASSFPIPSNEKTAPAGLPRCCETAKPAVSSVPQLLPWLLASLSALLLFVWGVLAWQRKRTNAPGPLPREWALTPRPVFSADERRVYRQLREALPHHVVLSKLPLVRFCQPNNPEDVRYWFELLGSTHVTFAICSPNGRVLAAIDLETDRVSVSKRAVAIKQAVLAACRVRYLRCPVDLLPSVPELQLLVPQTQVSQRAPQPASFAAGGSGSPVGSVAVGAGAARRRTTLWQDSGFMQDSFFGPDSRPDSLISDFGALNNSKPGGEAAPARPAAGTAVPRPAEAGASQSARRPEPPVRH
jgi:hypothetical protein